MIPPKSLFTKEEAKLLKSFRQLDQQKKSNVIAFAEFLNSGQTEIAIETKKEAVPKKIPRPAVESVVSGIKRLSEQYWMLDKGDMLDDTSVLMSAHLLQGKPAPEVIDELEILFRKTYENFKKE